MAELKTKQNSTSVAGLLGSIEDKQERSDAKKIAAMMRAATGSRAKMWGDSIVGFGSYHYKYASGREGDWMITGFSPRKHNLAIYIMPGFSQFDSLMKKLGKFKTGRSCLYVKSLSDVDEDVIKNLIEASVRLMRQKYETGK